MLFICCTDTYILTIKKLYVENKDVHANTCPCFNNVEENEFVQLLISSPNVEDVYSQVGSNSRVLLKVFIVFFKLKFLRKQLFYFLPIQVLLIRLFK